MQIETQNFVHLHIHSEYSLLEGVCRIKELVQQVKDCGQTAAALTDTGNLYGAVLFYQEAVKAGIKPIIGCEIHTVQKDQLVLLCENQQGYQNLIQIVSSEDPVDVSLLEKYHAGLICLLTGNYGILPGLLGSGRFSEAEQKLYQYRDVFGSENFYLGVQNHGLPEEQELLILLETVSHNAGIPMAADNQVYYLKPEDARTQKFLHCIRENQTLDELIVSGKAVPGKDFYLKTTEEMAELFSSLPEAVQNTEKIAGRCHLELTFHELRLPHFSQDGVTDHKAYFETLCREGMHRHYGPAPSAEVSERLAYEMQVIEQMGFTDYFLIVQDLIRYARSQEIPVGPGRGSAAGSLCAYCLDITAIDPVAEHLLFERFLNPGRHTMPDIDMDFCIEGRSKVKEYAVRRYGRDHVAEIVAFDTFKAKAAVRDIGRILKISESVVSAAAGMLNSQLTIPAALEQSPELRQKYDQDGQFRLLLDIASQIEGLPRHTTIHAAGIVMTDRPVTEYTPVFRNETMLVTGYPMDVLEELGLLKMDFLGLRNLTIIRDAERSVRMHEPGFSAEHLPEDDPEVYALISRGSTSGVFQLESDGMRQFLTQLRPQCMEDIQAALAIYRPGPMDSIPDYLENRKHPEKIQYLHPVLEEILRPTYGCILYQEQVMEICRKMAGYSLAQADIVRRAISKKKTDVMQQEKQHFLEGAVRNQIPETIASQVFAQMEKFAEYAFNKSHAAAYARIVYQTAFLKTHWFGDYMAALLSSVMAEKDKLLPYLEECRTAGLELCPPDVNSSEGKFVFRDQKLYFGLLAVKGLGQGLTDKMLAERRQHGSFLSFADFCRRMVPLGLYKKTLESIIRAGALDSLDYNRNQMLQFHEKMLEAVSAQNLSVVEGQMSLFGDTETEQELRLPAMPDLSAAEKLQMEKEICGIYLSGYPLDSLDWMKQLLRGTDIRNLSTLPEQTPVKLLCIIQSGKKIRTKNNAEMCFLQLEDHSGSAEAIIFPTVYASVKNQIRNGSLIFVTGKISYRNQHVSLICETIQEQRQFDSLLQSMQLCIKTDHSPGELQNLKRLSALCRNFPGDTQVVFYFTDSRNYAYPKQKLYLQLSENSYQALTKIISPEKIGCIAGIS